MRRELESSIIFLLLRNIYIGWTQWLKLVILAIWEVEIRKIRV
jgi:hypothetical protein